MDAIDEAVSLIRGAGDDRADRVSAIETRIAAIDQERERREKGLQRAA